MEDTDETVGENRRARVMRVAGLASLVVNCRAPGVAVTAAKAQR